METKVIIVTGGIGSGKSVACRFLSQKGVPVYDCDSRAKALYDVYPRLRDMVVPGIFDRPDALKALEDALFPLLMKDFENWKRERELEQLQSQPLKTEVFFVAFESATVLQKEFFDNFGDYVMLVDAPSNVRLERAAVRALRRDGGGADSAATDAELELLRTDIRRRMALQPDNRSNPRVTFILENTGSLEDVEPQIDRFLEKINYYTKR